MLCRLISCYLCTGVWNKVDTFEDFKEKVYLEMNNGECIFAEVSYCW